MTGVVPKKAADVETNPGPITTHKQVWILDIYHKQIHGRKQISIRCNRIEYWMHLRCAGIRQAQYTHTPPYPGPSPLPLHQRRSESNTCTSYLLVVSTHSLDPCLWGEFDHPAFGPPASLSLRLASSSINPAGSVHKSRGDNVVRMWVQLKR